MLSHSLIGRKPPCCNRSSEKTQAGVQRHLLFCCCSEGSTRPCLNSAVPALSALLQGIGFAGPQESLSGQRPSRQRCGCRSGCRYRCRSKRVQSLPHDDFENQSARTCILHSPRVPKPGTPGTNIALAHPFSPPSRGCDLSLYLTTVTNILIVTSSFHTKAYM